MRIPPHILLSWMDRRLWKKGVDTEILDPVRFLDGRHLPPRVFGQCHRYVEGVHNGGHECKSSL